MSPNRIERKLSDLNSMDRSGLAVIAIALSVIFGIAIVTG